MSNKAQTEIIQPKNHIDLKLKKFIENIEKLEEEKKEISEQISDIYKEAKTFGFDAKIMRKVIKLRKLDLDERIEIGNLLKDYTQALGMNIQMELF